METIQQPSVWTTLREAGAAQTLQESRVESGEQELGTVGKNNAALGSKFKSLCWRPAV